MSTVWSVHCTSYSVMGVLQGLPVSCYLEDILVAGKDKQEHDQWLEQVLQHLALSGIAITSKKVSFAIIEINYLGLSIDAMGIHPTESNQRSASAVSHTSAVSQLKAFIRSMN